MQLARAEIWLPTRSAPRRMDAPEVRQSAAPDRPGVNPPGNRRLVDSGRIAANVPAGERDQALQFVRHMPVNASASGGADDDDTARCRLLAGRDPAAQGPRIPRGRSIGRAHQGTGRRTVRLRRRRRTALARQRRDAVRQRRAHGVGTLCCRSHRRSHGKSNRGRSHYNRWSGHRDEHMFAIPVILLARIQSSGRNPYNWLRTAWQVIMLSDNLRPGQLG